MAALELESQLGMFDTQRSENRGMKVVDIHRITNDVVTEVVGFAVNQTGLDPAPSYPDGEAAGW